MKRLSEKEWKQFGFTEVFDIKKGFYNKKPEADGTGTIPFLGATDSNNGVTRFLTLEEIKHGTKTGDLHNSPLEKKLFPGHAIAVTNNGSVGHAFYQATEFTCSHDINPLYLRDHEMSREEADFLIKAIEKQGILFQYARKWRPIRMVKSKIMLPVDDKGNPDYAYMTLYSAGLRGGLLMRYKNFIAGQLSQLEHKDIPALNEKEWKEYDLSTVYNFDLAKGDIQLKKALPGHTPLVSAGFSDNGIVGFIETDTSSDVFSGNKLTIDMFGQPFYQPAPFQSVSHGRVNILSGKCISDAANMFIVSCVKAGTASKYSYNQMCSQKRLQRQKVMLPVDDKGNPDYEYMEQYAKNMILKKYKQYLAFIDRQSSANEVNI